MLYPFQYVLDIIFPPTKHELTLRFVTPVRFRAWYHPHLVQDVTCLSHYHLPEVQAAIAACKFEHSYHAASLVSVLISIYLAELEPHSTLLIPIPLSSKRQRKRLFNQVERVLQSASKPPYHCIIDAAVLVRSIDTTPQTTLTRAKRLHNVANAFVVSPTCSQTLKRFSRVIICDDVCTTGATLAAAKKALKPHVSPDTELICLAWAH